MNRIIVRKFNGDVIYAAERDTNNILDGMISEGIINPYMENNLLETDAYDDFTKTFLLVTSVPSVP